MVPPAAERASIEVFYDGECPLCRREVAFLRRRDSKGRIEFTDISAAAFDAAQYGMTRADFMAQIHGRLPNGEFVSGVEVFRQLYSAVGFRWVVALTRLPGLSWLLDVAYTAFARNRLRLTGRSKDAACSAPRHDGPGARN